VTMKLPDFGTAQPADVTTTAAAAAAEGVEPAAGAAATGTKRPLDEDGGEDVASNTSSLSKQYQVPGSLVPMEVVKMVGSRTLPGMAHSSYLTFAMKVTKAEKITIVCDPDTDDKGRGPGAGVDEPWVRVGDQKVPLGESFASDDAVVDKLKERDAAKAGKDYKQADVLRDQLHKLQIHFNDRQRTWEKMTDKAAGGPGGAAGGNKMMSLMVRSMRIPGDAAALFDGAKLVQVDGTIGVGDFARYIAQKLGLEVEVEALVGGEVVTEAMLLEIKTKGRGQVQVRPKE
jgi:hypothetical protein